ncbi:Wadjet anti-phage system protein JetD domain-containing protein [Aeromonas allosaccharophila]|uniref:Wadjet anti-phage system protein JetD domain-containing protein n=1 Tax=Aeromonas allosaccharophila TaxID=656 RepID=UPI00111B3580|nr:Wadjet anti-phage system protein JetD domain-containing protein [Aeromonas allosaccharophila]
MSLFDEVRVQALCAKLLDSQNEKGCSFESRHGRELKELLQAVGGVESVGRSAHHILTEAGRTYLAGQLAQVVPPEPDKREQLRSLGVSLPARLNQASFYALWHGDSKHPRSECADPQLADLMLTQDEVIRIRTLEPLSLVDRHGLQHDMTAVMTLLGELALPERALATLAAIDWQGERVITVENKGAFVDYPLQPGQLLLFAPGRNTTLAKRLIPLLPAGVQWAHFGDLDQRGIDIAIELARELQRPAMLWLPSELQPYLDHYARPVRTFATDSGKVPWRVTKQADQGDGHSTPVGLPWLDELVTKGAWLEQEVLILAARWQCWPLAAAGS